MDNKVLYHKKFGKVEMTISKTTWKEKVSFLVGAILLGLTIWYFTK
ncbi:hypothetical protein [Streptococcus suis]|uniref:Uncharacterized protein n=1 Tax=Streptococcus suis TaxID=1307 RepID=A0A0Z8R1G1_STRSU|nr:hypothetical protein [Streptococcus suis]MCB2942150.1 hypothetical protein [Streptococcus suis]MCB2944666.1 hypothetical protein [Streptococcus suis]MCB2956011.1 hypothetical protein [Streptococcus suis]MCB2962450.1 hypothetical protein [Streptococcus suis]MCQ8263910.1 hypothetical protein [Streptococcus suis]